MTDWENLTKEALQDLGAEQVMVPGAKLREHMVQAGYSTGFDVAGHVADSGTSFSRLVADVPGVTVEIRPGSDVVIGLDGARIPDRAAGHGGLAKSRSGGLRSDVYQAFTRVVKIPFVYSVEDGVTPTNWDSSETLHRMAAMGWSLGRTGS